MGIPMEVQDCIIGAGLAGLMSAIFAAQAGAKVVVIEKNTTAGRKLLLTGGGRCNLTHSGAADDFVRVYGRRGRFLRHCLYEFSPDATLEFFSRLGVPTRVDEFGCVFPISERAGDVRDALLGRCEKLGVRFIFDRRVEKIEKLKGQFQVYFADGVLAAEKVIIATGGASYPQTGSTGDGYTLAKSLGHTIVAPRPTLVPLVTVEQWPGKLAGTSLGDVKIFAMVECKKIVETGPMLFTQDGIGGPAVLDLSRHLADFLPAERPIEIVIDVVPAMSESGLDEYLIGQSSRHPKKTVANVLAGLTPKRLAALACTQTGIADNMNAGQLKKKQRSRVRQLLKKLAVSVRQTRPIEEATVTRGGVAISEIDPETMQSKLCPGLYFAGEVIDVDGPCGGYNLQIAWSTAALAGKSAAIQ
jgi:predicted Rossmann fold flavoprotein